MNKFKDKKILVLGGNAMSSDIVKTAQEMGLYVIVTDWNDSVKSPAKIIADEAWNLSLSDVDAIVDKIKENGIDGVVTGFTDSYLDYYRRICEKSGLPCYGREHQFLIGTDKMLFKDACRRAGVGVIPGGNAYSLEEAKAIAKNVGFPMIIKPVDNSGSRGVIKCEKAEDLESAYNFAVSYSPSQNVICEKYMDCENITGCYQLNDGHAKLAIIRDRHIYDAGNGSYITAGSLIPSKYIQRFMHEVDGPFKKMLHDEGFKNGAISFQGFVDQDGFYMCEVCYRMSGGRNYVLTDHVNGTNSLKLLIEFAVNGKLTDYDLDKENPSFAKPCAMAHIIGDADKTISLISGIEEVSQRNNVINLAFKLNEGDKIGAAGTTAQVIGTIWLTSDSLAKMKEELDEILGILKIQDETGNSLVKYCKFC